jgi:hypothetical protein
MEDGGALTRMEQEYLDKVEVRLQTAKSGLFLQLKEPVTAAMLHCKMSAIEQFGEDCLKKLE